MAKSSITLFAQKLEENEGLLIENRKEYDSFLEQAPPGRYVIEVKRSRPPKSQKQLGYIFPGMIAKIKEEGNEIRQDGVDGLLKYLLDPSIPKNQPLTDDFIKAVLYAIAPTFDDKGRKITLSSMNTLEAKIFIEQVQNLMAGYVYLENPDKNWRAKKQKK